MVFFAEGTGVSLAVESVVDNVKRHGRPATIILAGQRV
ncbi:hypothetical protein R69776_05166 [Paraburkholderia nemoris]|uniref:Uncharacterized protein n=1 Tax=Paraburkholderia nemoris TaxID=2793076 RepID=A0ABN7MJL5_9BURK|nr:hypothetical protein R75777_00021 [Paraburkholderia nemoris]CAE6799901.1 hypothetical protein R69776_05166 [Paraburkholderia nemoris]